MLANCVSYSDASLRPEELTRFTFTEYHMGVDARLTFYAETKDLAERAGKAAFDRIAELDTIMSDYRRDSELNRLCAKSGGPAVKVSPDLFLVLKRAVEVSKRSEGVFDITVGPVVALWRQARKTGTLPDAKELRQAHSRVGWQWIRLDEKTKSVRLATAGMKLDLGGIAKGYADDEAQKVLKRFGITRAMVEMGGDIVVTDAPPDKKGWIIRVPNAGDDKGPKDLEFTNCAISTSGDTEQFTIIGGVRYSHVVDPRTGQALTSRAQATVVARDGLTSDPLSKVFCILPPEKQARFLKFYPGVRTFLKVLKG